MTGNEPLIITIITLLSSLVIGIIVKLHIKHCKSTCCESDCSKSISRQNSKIEEIEEIKIIEV
jgi:hypothetical protein